MTDLKATTLHAIIDSDKTAMEVVDYIYELTGNKKSLITNRVFIDIGRMRNCGIIKLTDGCKWTISQWL